MLLGIPRVFGGTAGKKKADVVIESSPPPPDPPALVKDGPVPWMRAHPLQTALLAISVVLAVRRVFGKEKKAAVGTQMKGREMSGAVRPSGGLRAVPRRHESTEEALDLLGNRARKYIIVGDRKSVV